MNTKKKVIILYGLPGSGKTTYASSFGRKASVFHVDKLINKYKGYELAKSIAKELPGYFSNSSEQVIIDGLFTTNGDITRIVDIIRVEVKYYDLTFEVVWWEKDVAACLHNDRGRRKVDSKITIENLPFEEPDPTKLPSNIKLVRKKVVMKPEFEAWAEENVGGKVLASQSWCLGGTWGNCWGDKGTIHPTSQPTSFEEFDNLLENICPTMTIFQYKKIQKETVTIVDREDGDYYGGSAIYAHFSCNLEKLYNMLLEMGLIKDNDA